MIFVPVQWTYAGFQKATFNADSGDERSGAWGMPRQRLSAVCQTVICLSHAGPGSKKKLKLQPQYISWNFNYQLQTQNWDTQLNNMGNSRRFFFWKI